MGVSAVKLKFIKLSRKTSSVPAPPLWLWLRLGEGRGGWGRGEGRVGKVFPRTGVGLALSSHQPQPCLLAAPATGAWGLRAEGGPEPLRKSSVEDG